MPYLHIPFPLQGVHEIRALVVVEFKAEIFLLFALVLLLDKTKLSALMKGGHVNSFLTSQNVPLKPG